MKRVYYGICSVPAFLLIVLFLLPNSWPQGGPIFSLSIFLMIGIAILCPLIALIGMIWFCFAMMDQKPKLPPVISTILGILPGLLLLIGVHFSR